MSDNKKDFGDLIAGLITDMLTSVKSLFNKVSPKEKRGGKIYNWIIITCMVVLVALVYNLWNKAMDSKVVVRKEPMAITGQKVENEDLMGTEEGKYKKTKEAKLTEMLKEMQGGGKVIVNIQFESSEEKVVAININDSESVTEENDDSGGTRKINTKANGRTAVTLNEGDKEAPLITKVIEPKIVGVVVVAEKASSSIIRDEMTEAIRTLYNLKPTQVQVYPIGCEYEN